MFLGGAAPDAWLAPVLAVVLASTLRARHDICAASVGGGTAGEVVREMMREVVALVRGEVAPSPRLRREGCAAAAALAATVMVVDLPGESGAGVQARVAVEERAALIVLEVAVIG